MVFLYAKNVFRETGIPSADVDSGLTGKSIAGGHLDYAGAKGSNVVFTDSLLPELKNVRLTLTSSYLWDALGLPLTAFYDSRRKDSIRTVDNRDFQPYQYALVRLRDSRDRPVTAGGKEVEFFDTEPVDISDCYFCHSGQGPAARKSRRQGLTLQNCRFRVVPETWGKRGRVWP